MQHYSNPEEKYKTQCQKIRKNATRRLQKWKNQKNRNSQEKRKGAGSKKAEDSDESLISQDAEEEERLVELRVKFNW